MFKSRHALCTLIGLMVLAAVAINSSPLWASTPTVTPTETDWQFHTIVDADFIVPYVKIPQPQGVLLIDSRPYKPKYFKGHIPTAISLPHSQFDKLTDRLPENKDTLLIFYCGGPT